MQLLNDDGRGKSQDAINQRSKIFDLVLNLNSLNQNKDALQQLKEIAVKQKEVERSMPVYDEESEEECDAGGLFGDDDDYGDECYAACAPQSRMMAMPESVEMFDLCAAP